MLTRRAAIIGLGASAFAAPAIVRASSLMVLPRVRPRLWVPGASDHWAEFLDAFGKVVERIPLTTVMDGGGYAASVMTGTTMVFQRTAMITNIRMGQGQQPGAVVGLNAIMLHGDSARINITQSGGSADYLGTGDWVLGPGSRG